VVIEREAEVSSHETSPEHRSVPWWWPVTVVAAGSAFVRIWLVLAGNRFEYYQLRPSVWHLVEPDRLAANPLAPLWDVHTTPPLFNVFVGVVLRWSPLSDEMSFRLAFSLGAIVSAVALCEILRALGCRWWVAATVAVVMFANPAVIGYEFYVAQEALVIPLLYGTLWAVVRYARGPSLARLGWVLGLATVLVLSRALFHPVWMLGLVAVVLAVRPPPIGRGQLLLVIALPFVLVVGVMAKNEVRFGTFSLSSWMGMNLSRVAVLPLGEERRRELVEDGVLSELALVTPYQEYAAYEPYVPECRSAHGTQVLDDPVKGDGNEKIVNPNFNATCYLPVYQQAQRDAVAAIRAEPGIYARTVGANVVAYLSETDVRFGRPEGRMADALGDVYDVLALEVRATARYPGVWSIPGDVQITFVVGLVALLVAAARSVRRRLRSEAGARDLIVLVVAWTVVCTTVISVVADAFENGRFRSPLDPLVMGIVIAGLCELAARAVRASRPR
jgi:hypothetical protein